MKLYQYTFTRRQLILLALCLLLINLLTFSGGVVTGLGLWMPTQSQIAQIRQQQPTAVAKAAPTAPAAQLPSPLQAAPASAPPAQAPPVQPAPVPTAFVQTAPVQTTMNTPAQPAPQAAPAPAVLPNPSLETRAPVGKFAVQVGSFTDAKNAKQLETELKERGYAVHTFKALDNDKRIWHVVRIGEYGDLNSAARAAADFTNKEQVQALVRRADAL